MQHEYNASLEKLWRICVAILAGAAVFELMNLVRDG